jgi:hypothetical protein
VVGAVPPSRTRRSAKEFWRFSPWWAGTGLIIPILVLALATYGCWVSMAGKPLLKDEALAT